MNKDGVPIGGMAGFLRSLGSLIQLTQPSGVYIILDGQGSSQLEKTFYQNINQIEV